MEPATISALAALAGATVGGVTSFAATWLTQRTQARIQQLTHQLNRREDLYKAFIEEASKLYGDALVHQLSDVYKLVGLYSLISRMRIISSKATVAAADEIARTIIKTYDAPDKNLADLQDMVNRDQIDILRTFGEAARQEFHRLGV
jgi:hypothetical protein